MKREEILKKAIEKAQSSGWEYDVSEEQLCVTRYYSIIFSHDFAKAFWGEERFGANANDQDLWQADDLGVFFCGENWQ